ncbi:PASTA domain-containing protein [Kutzneria chonburiensis]|uniref:PASTA domain-containing protein n=1 Tax=Kutzneria chonburiensis TaxID=1483604 RepID=A0ABV6N8I5_9PSEU|nr:PASTA domain-containing protein [Kutzneria chonburiensis]
MLKFVVGVALATVATSCGPQTQPGGPPVTPTSSFVQHWAMPNLVGSGLQDAQDAIQKLTDNKIFFTSSHDAGGRGRHQVLDRDWKVCNQNIAAGTQIQAGVKIDFGVVKLSERCP